MEVFNGKRQLALRVPVIVGATLLTVFSMGRAQSAAPDAMPGPKLQYQSVLSGYKGFNDQRIQPWRETNEQVKNIGGWRAYARETDSADQAGALPQSGAAQADRPVTPPGAQPAPAPGVSTGRSGGKAPEKAPGNTLPPAAPADSHHKHHGHGSKP